VTAPFSISVVMLRHAAPAAIAYVVIVVAAAAVKQAGC